MIGNLRLISGLILFIFVCGHFLNHAVGITTIDAMSAVSQFTIDPWRTLPGTILILWALITHGCLAVWSTLQRRTFKSNSYDRLQLVLGFLIPLLIAEHLFATRLLHEVFDYSEGYPFVLYSLWVSAPFKGIILCIALITVWVHGCIGWHNWFKLKSWYAPYQKPALFMAILIPALALAGLLSSRFRTLDAASDRDWVQAIFEEFPSDIPSVISFVETGEASIFVTMIAIVFMILLYHGARIAWTRQRSKMHLQYRNPQTAFVGDLRLRPDTSILDTLRLAGIEHASVCGGRGRCSTCRIRIDVGQDALSAPGSTETKVLERISAPPNVRLACQVFPQTPLSVTALLGPNASVKDAGPRPRHQDGAEQDVVILFADLRAFTKLSETRLPYDVAYLLNRYFAAMGTAIEMSGGHLDKFIGDGVMAIFGIDTNIETASRQAIEATMQMARNLEQLNSDLSAELKDPLRIGIGLHSGLSIVGNMGFKSATSITAIGDVVNTASRLESLSKDHTAQLVVSERTASLSGFDFSAFPLHSVTVRGRTDALDVRVITSALMIEAKNGQEN